MSIMVDIKVYRSNERGFPVLASFSCPTGCGYGFGNVLLDEAAEKALAHIGEHDERGDDV